MAENTAPATFILILTLAMLVSASLSSCGQSCIATELGIADGMYHCQGSIFCQCSDGNLVGRITDCAQDCEDADDVIESIREYCGDVSTTSIASNMENTMMTDSSWPTTVTAHVTLTAIQGSSSSSEPLPSHSSIMIPNESDAMSPTSTSSPDSSIPAPSNVPTATKKSVGEAAQTRDASTPIPTSSASTVQVAPSVKPSPTPPEFSPSSTLAERYPKNTIVGIAVGASGGAFLIFGLVLGAYYRGRRRVYPRAESPPVLDEWSSSFGRVAEIDGREIGGHEWRAPAGSCELSEKIDD